MPALIAARALQGLGGGGLIALSQTIVGDAVSPRERGRYQGYFGAVFAIASIAGPVLGGVFAEHLHWTLIFWINLPLGLAAFVITGRALKALPRHERPHDLDFLGAALMVTGTIALLLALNWGGTRYAVGLAADRRPARRRVGSVRAVRLAHRPIAPEPFVPLAIMRNRVVAHAIGCASLAYGTMIALSIYAPVYFETVLGLSASAAGLMLIPFMGGVVIGSTIGGRLMSKVTHYKRIGLIGMPFAIAFAADDRACTRRGSTIAARRRAAVRHRRGLGTVAADHDGVGAERRAAVAARHRDRRDQLHARAHQRSDGRALRRVPVRRQRARA